MLYVDSLFYLCITLFCLALEFIIACTAHRFGSWYRSAVAANKKGKQTLILLGLVFQSAGMALLAYLGLVCFQRAMAFLA